MQTVHVQMEKLLVSKLRCHAEEGLFELEIVSNGMRVHVQLTTYA
jgi:hypothetical protein